MVSKGVIYGSVLQSHRRAQARMDSAVQQLLTSVDSKARVLWKLQFTQAGHVGTNEAWKPQTSEISKQILAFSLPCLDLEFNDSMISQVEEIWKEIMGTAVDSSEFLNFEERETQEDF